MPLELAKPIAAYFAAEQSDDARALANALDRLSVALRWHAEEKTAWLQSLISLAGDVRNLARQMPTSA